MKIFGRLRRARKLARPLPLPGKTPAKRVRRGAQSLPPEVCAQWLLRRGVEFEGFLVGVTEQAKQRLLGSHTEKLFATFPGPQVKRLATAFGGRYNSVTECRNITVR